jgi:hypothetical protein
MITARPKSLRINYPLLIFDPDARGSVLAAETADGKRIFPVRADAVAAAVGPRGDDLPQLSPEIVGGDTVIKRNPGGKTSPNELGVDGTAKLLAVVVRARAPG